MTVMTKTARRAVNRQIRALQRERRDWLTGIGIPRGTPWCNRPGSPGHAPEACEGCAIAAIHQDHADEIAGRIRQLQAQLIPADALTDHRMPLPGIPAGQAGPPREEAQQ